jgi:hypothetical protein
MNQCRRSFLGGVMLRSIIVLLTLGMALGCGGDGGRPSRTACGIAALAGPTLLLTEFAVPGRTLANHPAQLPEKLVARMAAGPAYPAVVGRADTAWVIGVEGSFTEDNLPGFGVLILDPSGTALGIMLYLGEPIQGAPILGQISVASIMVPLIGIQLDPARFEDPACPLFPDSLLW